MTEKTLKHELYKHGSYLISLKEAGSEFVNIDDEIKKNEELFQMASKKDHQPTFEVGEYYVSKTGIVFKIISKTTKDEIAAVKSLIDGEIIDGMIDTTEIMFRHSKPATAEQIAEFKRAEHFASKGRKLDEFRVGDKVSVVGTDEIVKIESLRGGAISGMTDLGDSYSISLLGGPTVTLIQTAEELREVENAD